MCVKNVVARILLAAIAKLDSTSDFVNYIESAGDCRDRYSDYK